MTRFKAVSLYFHHLSWQKTSNLFPKDELKIKLGLNTKEIRKRLRTTESNFVAELGVRDSHCIGSS